MSAPDPTAAMTHRVILDPLARRAQRRFLLVDWIAALGRLAWLPWLAPPLVLMLHRWVKAEAIGAAAVGLWLALACGLAWRGRRTAFGALAAWDAAAGRKDTFSSALVFSRDPGLASDPGRLLHLDRAAEAVDAATRRITLDLPLPRRRWMWLGPVAAIAVSLQPWWRPAIHPGDGPLTAEMLAAAQTEAARLARPDATDLAARTELTDPERRALEELARKQEELAKSLKNAAGSSPRELLDTLEQQARAAEDLARQLETDTNAWASGKMLAALRQHPDTADLAEAVLSKKPSRAAEEAAALSETLQNPALTSEVTERLKSTLDRALAQTDAGDRAKRVDQAVAAADEDLKADQPAAAGAEFAALADAFNRQNQRDKARQELEDLAEKLRGAGSSIMGHQGGDMKKMAGHEGESGPSSMPSMQPLGQAGDPSEASTPLPVPGLDHPAEPRTGQPSPRRGTPVPGTGPPPKNARPLAVIPGTNPQEATPLALATPIPGGTPGRGAVPGTGGQGPPGLGGSRPGRGATASGTSPTDLSAAAAQGEVAVSPGGEGESFTQAIQGQPRNEAATRAAKRTAAAFLKEQEKALDTENLPPARREQVRRYFESIRTHFGE